MKNLLLIGVLCTLFFSCKKKTEEDTTIRTLVFTKTAGYRHESIDAGKTMFRNKATEWNLTVTETEDAGTFTISNLNNYKLIVLLNCTGELFTDPQRAALQNFVRSGGRVLGIHGASDAEYNWAWYPQMLGGWFHSHPEIQEAVCYPVVADHLSTRGLPDRWSRTDEWYNIKSLQSDNVTVMAVDESTYTGGIHGSTHPISWHRSFEGGKIFYTAMGHTSETYSEPLFIQHIGGAIQWLTSQ
jgi:type 1 glutamine amidotransferase